MKRTFCAFSLLEVNICVLSLIFHSIAVTQLLSVYFPDSHLYPNVMLSPIFLVCLDKHLSRLDPTLLSQQSAMEIFFDGVINKEYFVDENGNYKDIEFWEGVELNADGDVISLHYNCQDIYSGNEPAFYKTPNFAFLPETVWKVTLVRHLLKRTVETADLPRGLTYLNEFSGSFDFENLPANIKKLDITKNEMTGSIDTSKLPRSLKEVIVTECDFEGSFDFAQLPPIMDALGLTCNRFHGTVRTADLPRNMTYFGIEYNLFSGEFDFHGLPRTLTYLYIDENNFHGSLTVAHLPDSLLAIQN